MRTLFGYVYFIRQGQENVFKIGYTSKDPLTRLSNLQTSSPYKLNLYGYIWGCNPEAMEKHYHYLCRKNHINNEWFEIDEYKAEILLKDCFTVYKGPMLAIDYIFLGQHATFYCNGTQVFIRASSIYPELFDLYLKHNTSSLIVLDAIAVDYYDFVRVLNRLIDKDVREFLNFPNINDILKYAQMTLYNELPSMNMIVSTSSVGGYYNFISDGEQVFSNTTKSMSDLPEIISKQEQQITLSNIEIKSFELEEQIEGKGSVYTILYHSFVPIWSEYQFKSNRGTVRYLDDFTYIMRLKGDSNQIRKIFNDSKKEFAEVGIKTELIKGAYRTERFKYYKSCLKRMTK